MNTVMIQRKIGGAAVAVVLSSLVPALAGTLDPGGTPGSKGTIKEATAMDTSIFAQQLKLIEARRSSWLEKAAASAPQLCSTVKHPAAVIDVQKDASAFQGWKAANPAPADSVCNRPLLPGESFILDFGNHLTGYFSFSVRR
ncbi:MAG: hypothetical protein WC701_14620, partial [Kiritimatiellales bacterium]